MIIDNLESGDYFFLCTDGVLHSISDNELVEILSQPITDKEKIDIIASKSYNSSDNNTAYLIGIEHVEGGQQNDIQPMCEDDMPCVPSGSTTVPLDKDAIITRDVKPAKTSTLSRLIKKIFH